MLTAVANLLLLVGVKIMWYNLNITSGFTKCTANVDIIDTNIS